MIIHVAWVAKYSAFTEQVVHNAYSELSFFSAVGTMVFDKNQSAFLAPFLVTRETSPRNLTRRPKCAVSTPFPSLPARQHPSSTLLPPRTKTTYVPPSTISSEPVQDHPEWRHLGPPLNHGPLPTIIYFALTAEQSLELDPFNQFVANIHPNSNLRILSVTLPFHTSDMLDNERAFHRWADTYRAGGDLVSGFVRKVSASIDSMIASNIIRRDSVYVAGLSRGGLLAAHLAIANQSVRACLAFAPVTVLSDLPEFSFESVTDEKPREKIRRASLLNDTVIDKLVDIPVRFYMGNFDKRVGTRNAFELVHLLAERAASRGVRSPPHEFVMYCSVGKHGHGTPPDVFQAGAQYIVSLVEEHEKELYRIAAQ